MSSEAVVGTLLLLAPRTGFIVFDFLVATVGSILKPPGGVYPPWVPYPPLFSITAACVSRAKPVLPLDLDFCSER